MSLKKLFVIAIFGTVVALMPPAAQAGPGLSLSESVKAGFLAAQPVLGKKVGQETFDGKPVMVVFFASW